MGCTQSVTSTAAVRAAPNNRRGVAKRPGRGNTAATTTLQAQQVTLQSAPNSGIQSNQDLHAVMTFRQMRRRGLPDPVVLHIMGQRNMKPSLYQDVLAPQDPPIIRKYQQLVVAGLPLEIIVIMMLQEGIQGSDVMNYVAQGLQPSIGTAPAAAATALSIAAAHQQQRNQQHQRPRLVRELEFNDVGLVKKQVRRGELEDRTKPVMEEGTFYGLREARKPPECMTWGVYEHWDEDFIVCERRFSNYPDIALTGTNQAYEALKARIKAGPLGSVPLYLGDKLARDRRNPKAQDWRVRPGWDTDCKQCERCYSEFPSMVVSGGNGVYKDLEKKIRQSRGEKPPCQQTNKPKPKQKTLEVEFNDVGSVVSETTTGRSEDRSALVVEDGMSFGFCQARNPPQDIHWGAREGWDNWYFVCERRFSNFPNIVVKGTRAAYEELKARIKAGPNGSVPLYLGARLARDPNNPKAQEWSIRPGWDTPDKECERCFSEFPSLVVWGTNKAYWDMERRIKQGEVMHLASSTPSEVAPTVPLATATLVSAEVSETGQTIHIPEATTETPSIQTAEEEKAGLKLPSGQSNRKGAHSSIHHTVTTESTGAASEPKPTQVRVPTKETSPAKTTSYPNVVHGGKVGCLILSNRGIMFKEQGDNGKKIKIEWSKVSKCQTPVQMTKPLVKVIATTNASKVFQMQDKDTVARLCDDIKERKKQIEESS